jgi:hypothetical protein
MNEPRDVRLLTPGVRLQSPEKIAIAIFLCLLLWLTGGNLASNFSPDNFHEELRILYHFDAARTNARDYAGRYLSQLPQPFLYAALTKAALGAGIDLIPFHRWLGFSCTLLMLAGGALSGWRVGGALTAAIATILIAAQPVYQYQIMSATPHAFAFPLLTWGLVFLLYDKPYFLAALTAFSGLLYPPISPVLGLALAWYLIFVRKTLCGTKQERLTGIVVLAATAAVSFALLWHQLAPIEGYGDVLRPGEKIDLYPENGPNGRHFYGVHHPLAYVLASAVGQLRFSLPVYFTVFVPMTMVAIGGLGLYYFRERPPYFRALVSFIVPSIIFCALVTMLRPYVAYRFLLYPLFTVLPLLFAYGLLTLCYAHAAKLRHPAAVIVALVTPLALAFSSTEGYRSFSTLKLGEPAQELMDYLRQTPADSLIASWPGDEETSLIPYVARRPVLVNYKAHYPAYEDYVGNMRTRTFDLIDAYLATNAEPIINLHCRWQVDYLVANRAKFSAESTSFEYFAPFDAHIAETYEAADASKFFLLQPSADKIAFATGDYVVLDLAKFVDSAGCPRED